MSFPILRKLYENSFLTFGDLAYVKFCLISLNTRLLKIPVVPWTVAPFIHPYPPTSNMLTPVPGSGVLWEKRVLPAAEALWACPMPWCEIFTPGAIMCPQIYFFFSEEYFQSLCLFRKIPLSAALNSGTGWVRLLLLLAKHSAVLKLNPRCSLWMAHLSLFCDHFILVGQNTEVCMICFRLMLWENSFRIWS